MESTRATDPGLNLLLEALPACKSCRAARRRCDTKLPSCGNCARAGRECTFYDHVLKEELPRSYIASLVNHLEAIDSDGQEGGDIARAPNQGPLERRDHVLRGRAEDGDAGSSVNGQQQKHYFAFSQGAYRYLGAQSPLLNLRSPPRLELPPHEPPSARPSFPSQAIPPRDGAITPVWHGYLIRIFFATVHQIYPILDPSLPWLSPDAVICLEAHPAEGFMLQMVYAIACHCDGERAPSLRPLASAAHGKALRLIDGATHEQQSASTLRVAVLLVLYAMFDPGSGNISQQLGFAIRLAIDLAGDGEDQALLATLYKVIYCLENDVCAVLARPMALPEPQGPITLSMEAGESPLDLLSGLYRIQSRIRRGLQVPNTLKRSLLLAVDQDNNTNAAAESLLHPNTCATLWETRLLLLEASPSPSGHRTRAAVRLVMAYAREGHLATFLTAHRVHEAANMIVDAAMAETAGGGEEGDRPLRHELLLAFGSATALLGRWSGVWEAAGILLRDIQTRMGASGDGRP